MRDYFFDIQTQHLQHYWRESNFVADTLAKEAISIQPNVAYMRHNLFPPTLIEACRNVWIFILREDKSFSMYNPIYVICSQALCTVVFFCIKNLYFNTILGYMPFQKKENYIGTEILITNRGKPLSYGKILIQIKLQSSTKKKIWTMARVYVVEKKETNNN